MRKNVNPAAIDFSEKSRELEHLSVSDLTDMLGIEEAAKLLDTTRRTIYTLRNTNALGVERRAALVNAVRANESTCRQRLLVLRQRQKELSAR